MIVDFQGLVLGLNEPAEKLFGMASADIAGEFVEMLVPTSKRWGHQAYRRGYLAEPRDREMDPGLYPEAETADGEIVPIIGRLQPVRVDGQLFVAAHMTATTRPGPSRPERPLAQSAGPAARVTVAECARPSRSVHPTTTMSPGWYRCSNAAQGGPGVHRCPVERHDLVAGQQTEGVERGVGLDGDHHRPRRPCHRRSRRLHVTPRNAGVPMWTVGDASPATICRAMARAWSMGMA